jgi:serine/threonine-protein kinase
VRVGWLVVAAMIALFVVACGGERVIELPHWTLHEIDGAPAGDAPIDLPRHLDASLPNGRVSTFVLRAQIDLPNDLHDQPLTLAIPYLEAPTDLRIDGAPAVALESGVTPGAPSRSMHAFRIEAPHAPAPVIDLVVHRDALRASWLDTIPRISATPYGDTRYLLVRLLNGPIVVAAFAVTSTIGFIYFVLHLFDLRRRSHLWFGGSAIGVAYYLLDRLGVPTALYGGQNLAAWFLVEAGVAGVYFTHAYFSLPTPRRWLPLSLVPIGVWTIVAHGAFQGATLGTVCSSIAFAFVVYQVVVLVRAWRAGKDRFGASALLAGWALLGVTAPPDAAYFMGFGHILGGAQTLVLGIGCFSVLQAIVLSRDHSRSLREADALNVELRRQLADRSRQLADALARIGAVPERIHTMQPGDVVQQRYRAVRRIGEGGMGAVWEVARITDDRRLALKVLTSASSGVALARLAREAQIASEVSHPNLVAMLDVDVSETGVLYLVMELVDGAPLHDARDRWKDAEWTRGVLVQIAKGLVALHARGVVHRDLKPGNVLLTREGVVKIADFGIARLDADTSPDPHAPTVQDPSDPSHPSRSDPALAPTVAASSSDSPLTATGVLLGTPLYMAPELGRGARQATPASDVFAFGVIGYELLAGHVPFTTPPVLEAMAGRALPDVDPPKGEAHVVACILRCLSADPRSRPTASEIASALVRPAAARAS